jgi:hypothetical protein
LGAPRPVSSRGIVPLIALAVIALVIAAGAAQLGAQAFLPIFGLLLLSVIVARPEYGVALLLSTFLMAYPQFIQGSGYLTLNNVLGGIFAVLLTYEVYRSQDWWFLRVPQVQLLLLIVGLYWLSETLNSPDPEKVNLLGAGFYHAEGLRIFINRVAFTLFFITFIRSPRNVRMIYMLALAFMMITALSGVQNVLAGGGLKGYRAFTGATDLVTGQVGVIRAAGNPKSPRDVRGAGDRRAVVPDAVDPFDDLARRHHSFVGDARTRGVLDGVAQRSRRPGPVHRGDRPRRWLRHPQALYRDSGGLIARGGDCAVRSREKPRANSEPARKRIGGERRR